MCCRYNTVNFFTNIHKRHPIARLLGKVWVSFVDPASDWYSASVPVNIYEISYNIGPRYNGTRLYLSLPCNYNCLCIFCNKTNANTFVVGFYSSFFWTRNVRGPSYLGLTRSISWLPMPWLLMSSGHQQPWYWLCRIGRFLSYLRKDFNYLRRINVEKWHKM